MECCTKSLHHDSLRCVTLGGRSRYFLLNYMKLANSSIQNSLLLIDLLNMVKVLEISTQVLSTSSRTKQARALSIQLCFTLVSSLYQAKVLKTHNVTSVSSNLVLSLCP